MLSVSGLSLLAGSRLGSAKPDAPAKSYRSRADTHGVDRLLLHAGAQAIPIAPSLSLRDFNNERALRPPNSIKAVRCTEQTRRMQERQCAMTKRQVRACEMEWTTFLGNSAVFARKPAPTGIFAKHFGFSHHAKVRKTTRRERRFVVRGGDLVVNHPRLRVANYITPEYASSVALLPGDLSKSGQHVESRHKVGERTPTLDGGPTTPEQLLVPNPEKRGATTNAQDRQSSEDGSPGNQ